MTDTTTDTTTDPTTGTTIAPTDGPTDGPRPVTFITWLVQYGNFGPARTLELDYFDDGAVLVVRQPAGLRVEYPAASPEAELLHSLFGRDRVCRFVDDDREERDAMDDPEFDTIPGSTPVPVTLDPQPGTTAPPSTR